MPSTERFCEALEYAVRLHAAQRRKGSDTPYIAHLLSVTAIVLEHGASEDEAIAALLHDAVEDQGGAPVREEIRRRFGPAVATIVDGCTDCDTTPKPPWRERKEAFLARLPSAGRSVHLVTAADKLHNAPLAGGRLSRARRVALGSLQRRPRRHALVLPRCGRHASLGAAQPAGAKARHRHVRIGTDGERS